jgi:hypothetical protein
VLDGIGTVGADCSRRVPVRHSPSRSCTWLPPPWPSRPAPVSLDREARVTEAGDYRFFAGWRSDPFFFDSVGALNNHSRATISSPTKTCAASSWKCLTLPWGLKRLAFGLGTPDGAGGSWVQADRGGPRNLSSFPARREMPTSPQSRRTMRVSSLSLRTRWSTQVGIPRRRHCG